MTNVLSFAILGIGIGGVYALVGQGLVLVYRGSGVLNIAQGTFAAAGAYLFYDLTNNAGWGSLPGVITAIAAVTVLGAVVHVVIMRKLATAAPLVRLIASLGLFVALQQAFALRYGSDVLVAPSILPQASVHILPDVRIGADRLIILSIAIAVSAALSLWFRYARVGLAISAMAEEQVTAASLGWSPLRLGALTWGLGAALAALAGIMIAPISGLDPVTASFVVVPALACALVGGFRSFWLTLAGGIVIGVAQSIASYYLNGSGWTTAVPFIVIVGMLLFRGRALPSRGEIAERLPRVTAGRVRWPGVLSAVAVGIVLVFVLPPVWADGITTTLEFALVLASVVVVTGFAGQLSLAQFALAGVGALVAARIVMAGLPYELAIVCAALACIPIGMAVGIVALRTRGASLAIATLALGLIIQGLVLQSTALTAGQNGLNTGFIKLFGVSVYPVAHSQRYAFVLIVVTALVCVALANLRRSTVGRRLVAVRGNERAAAALGVSVMHAKLYAFAVAASIAGLAGSFFAFRTNLLTFDIFSVQQSINVIALIVIGGVGYASGPVLGSIVAAGGVFAVAVSQWFGADISQALVIASGITVITLVMTNPDGLAAANEALARRIARRVGQRAVRRPGRRRPAAPPPAGTLSEVAPMPLVVRGLQVRYGGVRAVDDVSFEVSPGTVVGLIGPNGAGKTTLIDAVSGFVSYRAAEIRLGPGSLQGLPPHRRAARGLSRTFQAVELFEDLTVRENLLVAAYAPRARDWLIASAWPKSAALSAEALLVVDMLSLRDELDLEPGQLSLAKRRLAAVARSVVRWPSVLMLDEPASGLTVQEAQRLATMIRQVASACGIGILLVEHNVEVVMSAADRVIAMEFGKKISEGTPSQVRRDPEVLRAYLGTSEAQVQPAVIEDSAG